MYRIAHVTDAHVSTVAPSSRKDDYFRAVISKLDWASTYGNATGVKLWLDSGDLFDRAVQTMEELNALYEVLVKREAKTLAIVGNHPIKGNAELWRPHSGIYILEKMLGPDRFEILDPFKATVEVGGHKIRLHHIDLLRRPAIWKHVLWKDYDPEGATIVLCSHFHPRQGIARCRGVYFASSGALSRGTLAEDNLRRKPSFFLIDIGKGGDVDFKRVVVPHRPASEVFNEKAILTIQDVIRDDDALRECVHTLREMERAGEATVSIYDLLKIVRGGYQVSDQAFELAMERLKVVAERHV